jgi:hypothetical protein
MVNAVILLATKNWAERTRSALSLTAALVKSRLGANVCSWRILLQKSFRDGERKFLEPLMRLARGDVRDHIASSKIEHGPP